MKKTITIIAAAIATAFTTGCVSSGSGVGIRSAGNAHFVIKGNKDVTIELHDGNAEQIAGKTVDALNPGTSIAASKDGNASAGDVSQAKTATPVASDAASATN